MLILIITFAADVNFIQTLLPGNAASEVSDTVNSALLSGLQLADELEAEFCMPPYIQKGVNYPTECEVSTTHCTSFHLLSSDDPEPTHHKYKVITQMDHQLCVRDVTNVDQDFTC